MSAPMQDHLSQTTSFKEPHDIMPNQGRFISFEGTEGVGKTTAIEQLCSRLQDHGIDYLRTREPGGSPFAERLREILLDPVTDINDDTELLLLFAARCDHMQQVIIPALQRGTWVICDRFTDSTIASAGSITDSTSIGNTKTIADLRSVFNIHDHIYDDNGSPNTTQGPQPQI